MALYRVIGSNDRLVSPPLPFHLSPLLPACVKRARHHCDPDAVGFWHPWIQKYPGNSARTFGVSFLRGRGNDEEGGVVDGDRRNPQLIFVLGRFSGSCGGSL